MTDIDGEIWRPVKGFEDRYLVSNMGRVRSLGSCHDTGNNIIVFKEKIRSISLDSDGYCFLNFSINNKSIPQKVHRLVADAFIQNNEDLPTVNHKDCDKTNNSVENLEWVTKEANHAHAVKNGRMSGNGKNLPKLNKERCSRAVKQYDLTGKFLKEFPSVSDAARSVGTTPGNICNNIYGKYKHTKGYTWRYN